MASLKDYGIRFISHGAWSDAEIEWKKSKFQTVLFNYWDVAECTEYESLNHEDDDDLKLLVAQLYDLTPSGYKRPKIDYEWEVTNCKDFGCYYDGDYFNDHKLSEKGDFILHNTSQAFRQALDFLDESGQRDADIRIFKDDNGKKILVANYHLQGSTLKDVMY